MDLYHKKRSKICKFLPIFTAVFVLFSFFITPVNASYDSGDSNRILRVGFEGMREEL